MGKFVGGCLKVIGGIVVLLFALSMVTCVFGAMGASSSSSNTTDVSQEQQAESEKKEEEEKAEAKTEAKTEELKKKEKAEPEPESEPESKSGADATYGADYIRPEFQEFIDSYIAFYQEYADYMRLYNDDPTNLELLSGMSDLLNREADMTRAMDGWEAEDLTTAEQALLIDAEAEVLRISADVLDSVS